MLILFISLRITLLSSWQRQSVPNQTVQWQDTILLLQMVRTPSWFLIMRDSVAEKWIYKVYLRVKLQFWVHKFSGFLVYTVSFYYILQWKFVGRWVLSLFAKKFIEKPFSFRDISVELVTKLCRFFKPCFLQQLRKLHRKTVVYWIVICLKQSFCNLCSDNHNLLKLLITALFCIQNA